MNFPLSPEIQRQLEVLDSTQQAFVAGYLWSQSQAISTTDLAPAGTLNVPSRNITILSASQTGNAYGVAKQLLAQMEAANITANLVSAGDFKARKLIKEDIVVLVVSTQGEGEPPEEAVPLNRYLFGKKAPKLDSLNFAVFALGDTSYPSFCKAGKDFDEKLAELGAKRLMPRVDADLDFQLPATKWIEETVDVIGKLTSVSGGASSNDVIGVSETSNIYDKKSPYLAECLEYQSLVDVDSDKQTVHVAIDLGESKLHYQPGDALGIISQNADAVVDEVLTLSGLSADESIYVSNGQKSLVEALRHDFDLNQLTPQFIAQYRQWCSDDIDADIDISRISLVALLHGFAPQSKDFTGQVLCDLLKPLTPRLYSISSSQAEVGEEVHLCVGEVSFEHHGQRYNGSATGMLSSLEEEDNLSVFIEPNKRFRLPENKDTAIIMIGAGTGIAPFRGFMQQRSADQAVGKNWLFFGNRHFRKDFLYQSEWLSYRDSGLLSRIDLAWSRDVANDRAQVYVQDKLREQATDIYECDDAPRMEKISEIAEHRLKILKFWEKHGLQAALDAFEISRRSLYDYRRRLKNYGVLGLNDKSKRPKRLRQSNWDSRIIGKIENLRKQLPNIGKEQLHLLLTPFCQSLDLACPSVSTIGRMIAKVPDKMHHNLMQNKGNGLITDEQDIIKQQKMHRTHTVYVQDKIREQAADVWQWLQDGAHFYVCGDALRMAKDVEKALLEIITEQGGYDEADAVDYLNTLREDDRYQRDIY